VPVQAPAPSAAAAPGMPVNISAELAAGRTKIGRSSFWNEEKVGRGHIMQVSGRLSAALRLLHAGRAAGGGGDAVRQRLEPHLCARG
jgi:hypothetical protein